MSDKRRTRRLRSDNRWTGAVLPAVLTASIDWFVPPRVRGGDPELLRPARLVVTFGWALISLALIYAAVFFWMNSPIGAAALVTGAGVGVGSLCVMRRTGSCFAAGNLITAAFFGVLTVLACRLGGHGSLALPWYAAVPVVALSTAGRRSAVFWLAVTASSLAAFYTLGSSGYSLPNDLTPHHYGLLCLLAWIGLIVLVLALALLYELARDQMLRQLREAREFLETALAQSPSGIVIADAPDVTIRLANQAAFGIRGGDQSILTGIDLARHAENWQTYRPDGSPYPPEQLPLSRAVLQGEVVQNEEIIIRDEEGNDHWVSANAAPVRDAKAQVTAGIVVFHDITEHKRAVEKLRESEQRFRDLAELLPQTVFEMNLEGRLTFVNRNSRAMFGYSQEGLEAGLNNLDMLAPEDRERARRNMECIVRGENLGGNEYVAQRKDGSRFPIVIYSTPILRQGRPAGLRGIIVDITEHKRAERQLKQYATALEGQKADVEELYGAAEAANRAKSEFLANMSHEIRTPLTAVLGFTDVILEASREPQVQDAATTIQRNARHLLGVITDILDLSKVEAGKLRMDPQRCSPGQVVADVVSLMRVQADSKRLALRVSYAGPIPETIETDAARLRQILLNLIGNAVKFTDLGQIELCVRLADGPDREPRLRFDVEDTGIGMTDQQMAELFQPFHQVDTSSSRRFGGTGLGLAISKRLAEMLGGDLTVESTPGRGSTFSLTIATGALDDVRMSSPTEEADDDSPREAQTLSRPAAPELKGRILLAEDGPDNQRLISILLKKAGAEVVLAENGQEALQKALAAVPGRGQGHSDERASIDLVLMDVQMPVMDGLEATRRLRQAGYDRPILALTAHAMQHDVQRCLDAGCDAHLAKPIDREKFLATVAHFLHAGEARSAECVPESGCQGDPHDRAIHMEEELSAEAGPPRSPGEDES
ncbi:MAG TPA: PAS domain S-box protein [Thermoguttaceae bacterium]|nr:PAS domain S-box protein [Thermoguttaceae bacterium]